MSTWELAFERLDVRSSADFAGPDFSKGAGAEPVAVVEYHLGFEWALVIERRVLAPTGGPTDLRIEPVVGVHDESPIGGLDSWGITQADLRAIPIRDARERLERLSVEFRAADVIDALPSEFQTDWQYAKLADVVVLLAGWQIRNPAGVIAKRRADDSPNTWASRVKRARTRGLLGEGPSVTAKARALLAD